MQCTGPRAQKGYTLGLAFCSCLLRFLVILEQGAHIFILHQALQITQQVLERAWKIQTHCTDVLWLFLLAIIATHTSHLP